MEYKKTLNMTKSGFPMRRPAQAGAGDRSSTWEELDLYQ